MNEEHLFTSVTNKDLADWQKPVNGKWKDIWEEKYSLIFSFSGF